jgi:hypothetical protein
MRIIGSDGEPDESGPVTIKLERYGTLTGRLVGDGDQTRAEVVMTCHRPNEDGDSRFEKGSR